MAVGSWRLAAAVVEALPVAVVQIQTRHRTDSLPWELPVHDSTPTNHLVSELPLEALG